MHTATIPYVLPGCGRPRRDAAADRLLGRQRQQITRGFAGTFCDTTNHRGAGSVVGLDATQFADHSLRVGFVTSAVRAGKGVPKIMEQTGHRSANTVMAYVREADRWRDPASGGIGL